MPCPVICRAFLSEPRLCVFQPISRDRLLTSPEFVVKYAQEALFRQTFAGEGIVKQPAVSTERNRTASDRVTVSESIRVMKPGGKGKRISKKQNSLAVLKRRNER